MGEILNRHITRTIKVRSKIYAKLHDDTGATDVLHGADDNTLIEGLKGLFEDEEILKAVAERNGHNDREDNKRVGNRKVFERRKYTINN